MSFNVYFTEDAEEDLNEIYSYILHNDSSESALYVIKEIEKMIRSLESFPERGTVPNELSEIGVNDFRELFFKPYRIIYKTEKENIYIMLVVDSRRSLQSLLERRLLR
ncbi:MAG: type II toxin-antitoxin system RelE/ParE family toxin [Flexistipes sinusarabici]|uniref:Type II toxin-antitoxin system RelE/ParE family toxin n=1 Tax=Flexistipes sinusarabici TaxID=2352 RepID=A0A5D0MUU7_FLESI|nr:type II toxin-antitoxin system RelE/ParE family toxin [Flexistipes sinusarabici]TYB35805.1 MAG: type II toxin-antitoxin system RelE/ParE family toxin [Flexistipes sinusarabici]